MSDYPIVVLSSDALLTTTRSVRKRLDLTKPVPIGLIRECREIAVQAPTSANGDGWTDPIVVTSSEIGIAALAGFVRWQMSTYWLSSATLRGSSCGS